MKRSQKSKVKRPAKMRKPRRSARLFGEILEQRRLLAIDVTSLDVVTGEIAIAGDQDDDGLILSINMDGRLEHNLPTAGSTGDYADSFDFDPSAAVQEFVGDASITVFVDLGEGTNQLTIVDSNATFLGGTLVEMTDATGNGDDLVIGPDALNEWQLLAATGSGQLNGGQLLFSGTESLQGGNDSDRFLFASPGIGLTGNLDGGDGGDSLDYSNYSEVVSVDLSLSVATDVGGDVTSVEEVIGGGGDDMLIGNDVDNVLVGGGGSDLLEGAGGDDMLERR